MSVHFFGSCYFAALLYPSFGWSYALDKFVEFTGIACNAIFMAKCMLSAVLHCIFGASLQVYFELNACHRPVYNCVNSSPASQHVSVKSQTFKRHTYWSFGLLSWLYTCWDLGITACAFADWSKVFLLLALLAGSGLASLTQLSCELTGLLRDLLPIVSYNS